MGLIAQLKRRNVFKVCMAYLALYWVYELTPEGLKRDTDVSATAGRRRAAL